MAETKKMSENSAKVLAYLKETNGQKLTADEIAEALDMAKATINGVFTSFQKKGLGVREEATVTGTSEISFLKLTDEGKAIEDVTAEDLKFSENAQKIITHLQENADVNETLDDLAEALDIGKRTVNGAYNSLVKKGYAERVKATVEAPVTVKYLVLTDEGLAYEDAE